MCCSCQEKTLKWWGMGFMIAFTTCAVVLIILAGVNYEMFDLNWTKHGFNAIAAVQIAVVCYVLGTCVVGFFAFMCSSVCLLVIVKFIFNLVLYSFGDFDIIHFCYCCFRINC